MTSKLKKFFFYDFRSPSVKKIEIIIKKQKLFHRNDLVSQNVWNIFILKPVKIFKFVASRMMFWTIHVNSLRVEVPHVFKIKIKLEQVSICKWYQVNNPIKKTIQRKQPNKTNKQRRNQNRQNSTKNKITNIQSKTRQNRHRQKSRRQHKQKLTYTSSMLGNETTQHWHSNHAKYETHSIEIKMKNDNKYWKCIKNENMVTLDYDKDEGVFIHWKNKMIITTKMHSTNLQRFQNFAILSKYEPNGMTTSHNHRHSCCTGSMKNW